MSKLRRVLGRTTRWAGVFTAFALTGVAADGWKAFGKRASGERRARMERSAQWKDGHFENPQPLSNDMVGAMAAAFKASPFTSPASALAPARVDPERFKTPPASGLRVTWLGHSTMLIEVDGHRVLTDPVWSERASPFTWAGPRRWYPPLLALEELPPLDAVVISHDHYDHLDHATILAMKGWDTTFIVPLGVGAHLAYWGVPESRIVELDWWERAKVRELEIVATPARHASGRTAMAGQNQTLWAGYAFIGREHRAWYSGDTGLFPGLEEIGARLGPFEVTMIEAGAYGRWWPDWHIGPEQAVRAHQMVRGQTLLPVHWGLFTLAFHGWTEPVERVLAAAGKAAVTVATPRPGESFEGGGLPPSERWWPKVAWVGAGEDPIVSSRMK
ncbi:MAG: MBL fold metallo-hydrolase [Myxococcaceae bacterium]